MAKISLENLNGGHAICVKSTPEIEAGDVKSISVSNGTTTKIEVGRKGTFADSIEAKYVTMIYAKNNSELTLSFEPSFNNKAIQIFVMKSPLQTKMNPRANQQR